MLKKTLSIMIIFLGWSIPLISMADYSFTTVDPLQFSPYTNYFPGRTPNPYNLNPQNFNSYSDRCQYPYGYRNFGLFNRGYYSPYGYYGSDNNYIKDQIVRNAGRNLLYSLINH